MAKDRDEVLAEMHQEYLDEVAESGVPVHLLDTYGMPSFNMSDFEDLPVGNEIEFPMHNIEAINLPSVKPQHHLCPVCSDVIPIQNEYCDLTCGKIYHDRMKESTIDPDTIQ